jgi:hypothetical protein
MAVFLYQELNSKIETAMDLQSYRVVKESAFGLPTITGTAPNSVPVMIKMDNNEVQLHGA